jgi:serine/threonine protein phosphatase 1
MADASFPRVIKDRPRRVFAVGDIHGCIDEIRVLINFLTNEQALDERDQLVFIGDYIDRGRGSRQVIELMLSLKERWPHTVFLKGNHEDMLLAFLGFEGQGGDVYLVNGGNAFFESYGIDPVGSLSDIREQVPATHMDFLHGLELGVVLGEFMFVHAGVHPAKPLDEQGVEDLLWIRHEFVQAPHNFGKTVVFGHTAFNEVLVDLPYKIGIDTGAIYGNQLSIVELVHGDLYQVSVGESVVRTSRLQPPD